MSTPRIRRNRTTLTVTETQKARIRAERLTLRDLRALVDAVTDLPDTAQVTTYSPGLHEYGTGAYSITVTDTMEV